MTVHEQARSISASVEVDADPTIAFEVFTAELDCWWLQGPINFHDATRAWAMRMEPGVGGRILEVHDLDGVDGLEVARITEWSPPGRLAFRSSLDDVETVVTFAPSGDGTLVQVVATVPAGGVDRGGTSWTRVVPTWLGRWLARREDATHVPETLSRLAVALTYERPAAAARWLRDTFCLSPASRLPDEETEDHAWFELRAGDAAIIVLARDPSTAAGGAVVPWVFVDDVDEHLAHASERGASIVHGIVHHGARYYEVTDVEGNVWTFAQASPRQLARDHRR
jgi:uncharacterized glyoxalase superfamily protein PhnB